MVGVWAKAKAEASSAKAVSSRCFRMVLCGLGLQDRGNGGKEEGGKEDSGFCYKKCGGGDAG